MNNKERKIQPDGLAVRKSILRHGRIIIGEEEWNHERSRGEIG
jgi:hypothetical protein